MITAKQLLIDTRALIADPQHWLRGVYATDAKGATCGEWQPQATCFCLQGAASKAIIDRGAQFGSDEYYDHLDAMSQLVPWPRVNGDPQAWETFNDQASHNAVLALLDRAIAEAK